MTIASDGYRLQERHWAPVGVPRGTVIALHGIQSHGGWYARSSRTLAAAGYDVSYLDRRGSGLHPTQRGHALHDERLIRDVTQRLEEQRLRTLAPGPLVLMGVSWGGKLAAAVALRRPELIDGLALLYPGLCPRVKPTWWQKWQVWAADARGWGGVTVPIPLNEPELFTSDPDWQDFIRRDELALQRVTIAFLQANWRLEAYIQQHADELRCPVLMMLAGQDRIIDNAASRALAARFQSPNKMVREYPDACHTLEFEPSPHPFERDLRDWLDSLPRNTGK